MDAAILGGHWGTPTWACVLQICWVSLGAENQGLVGNPSENFLFCVNNSVGLDGGRRKGCEVVLHPALAVSADHGTIEGVGVGRDLG